MSGTVFVSGATGFIAQHVIGQLLAKGYKVVGSVRSAAKGDHLLALFDNGNLSYKVVPDIAVSGAFDQALKECPEVSVFLHTASPFTFTIEDVERDLLKPAVEGTRNALQAILKFGKNVDHVVITSSYAAVGTASLEYDPSHVNNEESWNNITREEALKDNRSGYRGSKTLAEHAAWDFVEEHRPQFKLSTVNPTFVFGPQKFDSEVKENLNTSLDMINKIIRNGPDQQLGPGAFGAVDVRDVADAHLVAFENEKAEGKRLLLNCDRFTSQTIVDILNEGLPELKGKIPLGTPGSDKEEIEKLCKIDNAKTIALLGHDLITLRQSVLESAKQILSAIN